MNKRFTIAIIHRNEASRLKTALDSALLASSDNDEIIVVDNNSDDNSIQTIEAGELYKKVNFIKNTCNAGYGYSCNQAMHQAQGKYFLLCNNDIKLSKNCLDNFESLFESDPAAGLIGPQMYSPKGVKMRSYSTQNPSLMSQLDLIGRPIKNKVLIQFSPASILRGACLAVKREMTEDIGMYDEDFYFYHEETEWCVRINRSEKWRVMFAPEIQISHVGGGSTSSVFAASRIEFFRSRLIFWRKVFSTPQLTILYLWNIPKLLIDWAFYLMATMLTIGLNQRLKKKLVDRSIVIAWLLLGRPHHWGLPNKCS